MDGPFLEYFQISNLMKSQVLRSKKNALQVKDVNFNCIVILLTKINNNKRITIRRTIIIIIFSNISIVIVIKVLVCPREIKICSGSSMKNVHSDSVIILQHIPLTPCPY